jgi:hypothetical protein
MQYSTEEVPQAVQDALAAYRGNFATKNARYRSAVCEHLGLQWKSVNGDGNCFFEAVCQLLHAAGADKLGLFQRGPDALTPARLRLDIVRMFEACIGGKELFHERIQAEIEFEASQPLVCSTRAKIRGEKVNGLVPDSTAQYLEASAIDGVWVTGWQWLRAISFMFSVRVGVVIYGQEIIRFFGEGQHSIYLYKVLFHFVAQLRSVFARLHTAPTLLPGGC